MSWNLLTAMSNCFNNITAVAVISPPSLLFSAGHHLCLLSCAEVLPFNLKAEENIGLKCYDKYKKKKPSKDTYKTSLSNEEKYII